MPVSLTTPANDTARPPRNRANRLAALLAEMLASVQTQNGDFPQHGFYATAFAIALWHGLDPGKYQTAITHAIHALQKQDDGNKYHREFIEFALSQTMAFRANQRREILRRKPWQNARVGNWLILRMVCLEKGGVLSRLAAKVLWRLIDGKFRDGAAFLDRPGCFSAQYHAFCAALLTFSQQPACQQAGLDAAKLINDITRQSSHANLIGRGAGQSFGIISAIYALLHAGFDRPAEKLLDQIEQSLLAHQNLPLNLLADPSDDASDEANARRKPGWYSYNRHYDYLAFAGFLLMRAGQLPERKAATSLQTSKPPALTPAPKIFRITSGETYCAQMTLAGKSPYDIAPMPVVTSAQGDIILPPCGGEQDFISPYNSHSLPLPILLPAPKGVLRCATPSSAMYQDDTFLMPFKIGGYAGQREIRFSPFEITFTDQIFAFNQPDDTENSGLTARLFRLFIPQDLVAERQSETCILFPQQGLQIDADTTLHLTPSHHFSALGRVQVLFCQLPYAPETGCCATLTMCWQRGG
ncbi:hypothetical protein [Thalassospira marina]|uniref:Uncharacterized protein n=1 Tax=Thalassospira marina TaxID=2048283 RepID=A0A2N3KZI3_9PROT|nr:hypothetical protein [Thalassospira marina]PKR55982.1 hypothetical protein COO20_01845 [Thalassospira marina]